MEGDNAKFKLGAMWLATVGGFLWLAYIGLNSEGVPVHDELTHYFIAADAWKTPTLILDRWGRTVNTLLYMPGARFGLTGARCESMIMALATGLLTLLLARKLRVRYLFLVPLFLWFQPWYADLSYTCTTEVPFTLVMVGGMCLVASSRLRWAALVVGLLPMIRHEGIAFAAVIAVWAAWRKDWVSAVLAFVPLAIYNVVHFAVLGGAPLAIYLHPAPTEFYGRGTWAHFVAPLAAGAGLPVLLLAANAAAPAVASAERRLVFACYLLYPAIHAVIFHYGLFASGGYGLFLLPMAPGLAVGAALGMEFIVAHGRAFLAAQGLDDRRQETARGMFVGACGMILLIVAVETQPRPLDAEGKLAQETVRWLQAEGHADGTVMTSHPFVHYFLPEHSNRPPALPMKPVEMAKGTVLVWDFHYSERVGAKYKDLIDDPRTWERLQHYDFSDGKPAMVVFRKKAD